MGNEAVAMPRDNSALLQHFKIFEDFAKGTVLDA